MNFDISIFFVFIRKPFYELLSYARYKFVSKGINVCATLSFCNTFSFLLIRTVWLFANNHFFSDLVKYQTNISTKNERTAGTSFQNVGKDISFDLKVLQNCRNSYNKRFMLVFAAHDPPPQKKNNIFCHRRQYLPISTHL